MVDEEDPFKIVKVEDRTDNKTKVMHPMESTMKLKRVGIMLAKST
jgi:dolichyl-phosphate-mannose--protein O-mannosyl transferase